MKRFNVLPKQKWVGCSSIRKPIPATWKKERKKEGTTTFAPQNPSQNYGKCPLNSILLKHIPQISTQKHPKKHFSSDVYTITLPDNYTQLFIGNYASSNSLSHTCLTSLQSWWNWLWSGPNQRKNFLFFIPTTYGILKVERESARVVTILWMKKHFVYTSMMQWPIKANTGSLPHMAYKKDGRIPPGKGKCPGTHRGSRRSPCSSPSLLRRLAAWQALSKCCKNRSLSSCEFPPKWPPSLNLAALKARPDLACNLECGNHTWTMMTILSSSWSKRGEWLPGQIHPRQPVQQQPGCLWAAWTATQIEGASQESSSLRR